MATRLVFLYPVPFCGEVASEERSRKRAAAWLNLTGVSRLELEVHRYICTCHPYSAISTIRTCHPYSAISTISIRHPYSAISTINIRHPYSAISTIRTRHPYSAIRTPP